MSLTKIIKKIKESTLWDQYLKKKDFKSNTWYFYMKYGIGDAYIVGSLLREFIRVHGKTVLIFSKQDQAFIAGLFLKNVDILIEEDPPYKLIQEFSRFEKGSPIILHPHALFNEKLLHLIGLHGTTLTEMYKIIMGIDVKTVPQRPSFPTIADDILKAYFDKHRLAENKTVLLCPKAHSISDLDPEFWFTLADTFTRSGFTPAFMKAPFVKPGSGYINFSFLLEHAKAFCDRAGYVVALRSGFCDLIATSSARKVILYPEIQFYSGSLISSCSLYRMQLADEKDLLEFELNAHTPKNITKIINFIHE